MGGLEERVLAKVGGTNRRVGETSRRIDRLQEVLLSKMEGLNRRIDGLYKLYVDLAAAVRAPGRLRLCWRLLLCSLCL